MIWNRSWWIIFIIEQRKKGGFNSGSWLEKNDTKTDNNIVIIIKLNKNNQKMTLKTLHFDVLWINIGEKGD